MLRKIVNCAFSLSELINLPLSPWFMQTSVKDYARVLNVWFFLNLFPPNVFTSFWPAFSIFWHIKARSDTFRYNHIYSGIIQTYLGISEPCVILAYSTHSYIFKTLLYCRFLNYCQERHIQSPGIFRSSDWEVLGEERRGWQPRAVNFDIPLSIKLL